MIRILLVDDNRIVVRALCTAIPWEKYNMQIVAYAYDGESAQALLNEEIDILITDIRMPRIDGIELTRYCGEHFPQIQVIFISSYTEFEYVISGLKLKVFDYISKPVDNDKLVDCVQRAYEHAVSEQEVKDLVADSIPYMRERVVINFLMGNLNIEQKWLKRLFPDWTENTWFTCMVFDLLKNGMDAAIWEVKALIEHRLPDVICAVMNDGLIVALFSNEQEPDEVQIKQWLKQANAIVEFEKQLGRQLTVGVSQSKTGYVILKNIYLQALRALNMRFLLGRDEVYVYPGLTESVSPNGQAISNVISCAEGLSNMVEEQSLEKRLDELTQTLGQLKQQDLFVIAACSALGMYVKDMLNYMQDHEAMFQACVDVYGEIYNGTQQEAIEALCGFIKTMRTTCFSKMRMENKQIIQKIYDAIEKVVFEPDGGLERVAQEVYLSPSYVSMLFKQETGKSLRQYLCQLRLKKAQKLLRDPNIKIYEVSQMVGYPNQFYFSVWFKKYTGMTPSEYRNEI